jgi:hypothetical protein
VLLRKENRPSLRDGSFTSWCCVVFRFWTKSKLQREAASPDEPNDEGAPDNDAAATVAADPLSTSSWSFVRLFDDEDYCVWAAAGPHPSRQELLVRRFGR